MWPRTELTELLGIEHPIIQAPMASASTPELAAAVSNAGGLGSLGLGTSSVEAARSAIEQVQQATDRPLNANFFAHSTPPTGGDAGDMRAHLAPYYAELSLGDVPDPAPLFPTFGDAQLGLLLDTCPAVVSFHYGLPSAEAVEALKATGATILSSATTVTEAVRLAEAGADAIIAQGAEAGGHRGVVDLDEHADIGTVALVPQVVDAVDVPVIAAGGIADGRGIAASLVLGAAGVQIGTGFLRCPEAATDDAYRQALSQASAEDTTVTRVFSGRPARALRNRLTAELAPHESDVLPFPVQYGLIGPLGAGSADLRPLWAGQAAPLARPLPAQKLIAVLVTETREALAGR